MAQVSVPKGTTTTPIQQPGYTPSTADFRKSLGLPDDSASDDIWARRLAAGTHTLADAQAAIQQKANQMGVKPPTQQPTPYQPSFDFNPQYNQGMNQINQQRAQFQADHNSQLQRINEDASRAREDVGRWRDESLKANTEGMADRGLVHSGINIQKQSDIGEEFTRFQDQIGLAQARGQEDLARFLTQQMNQLQNMQGELERMRAEKQAMIERERAQHEAINRTPQPTASGRYDLSHIAITNQGVQGVQQQGAHSGMDLRYMSDPNELAKRVEAIFTNRNVPIVSSHETDAQRIARIVNEVATGQRDLNSVRASVDRIAQNMNL